MNTSSYQIEINGLHKHYGAFHALKDIDIKVRQGAFVALVGPSGCGKSTLLRTLAGLEILTSGDIRIAGESVAKRPPRQRDVAMVFQSYALYPHMTVEQNMNYALRLRKTPRAEIDAATRKAAETLGLTGLMHRYPRELSGGQRQRVAMGRAIVRNPKVFLFDEPLSNLDASLRVSMRKEIRALHNRLGATSVYVTHDQIEAMTMADHVVVLRAGAIEQQGAPLDLYDRPVNRFVAGFIGSPAMNFVSALMLDGGKLELELEGNPVISVNCATTAGKPVIVGLRPEHLMSGAPEDGIKLTITTMESTGSSTFLELGALAPIAMVRQGRDGLAVGDALSISIDPANVHLFDPQTGQRI